MKEEVTRFVVAEKGVGLTNEISTAVLPSVDTN